MRRVWSSITGAAVAALLAGCTLTTSGVAVKAPQSRVPVENLGDDTTSVMVQDIVTDAVDYWERRGVSLSSIRFIQWDSLEGDDPLACRGSVFPQPAYCREGWLAWDHSWARKAMMRDPVTLTVYVSRAVADAVLDKSGYPYDPLAAVDVQECFTGAYMAGSRAATARVMRNVITNPSAYIRGLESTDPIQDCANV